MIIHIKDVIIPQLSSEKSDIIIQDGILRKYDEEFKADRVIQGKELYLIPAFTDVGTFNGEPGHEERETLDSLTRAALNGGFKSLIVLPHTDPVADNGSQIRNISRNSGLNGINLYPLGSISRQCEGKDIAEMLDMTREGAVGFTDGYRSVQSSGLLIRALDYAKRSESLIMNHPYDASVINGGLMHEGEMSTRLGLTGIPAVAEELMLMRDISLLEYTQSRLHIWNITTAEAVEMIREAKVKGLNISCSVSYLHLLNTDADLEGYNVRLKIDPVLRSEADRVALVEAVKDGTIDCIDSLHCPWNKEKKDLEFTRSASGAAGLETMFSALWTYEPALRNWELLNRVLNKRPREIFGLEPYEIAWDMPFQGTLVDKGAEFTFDESHKSSNADNYPYIGDVFNILVKPLKL